MKLLLLATSVFFATPAIADDLDDAAAVCNQPDKIIPFTGSPLSHGPRVTYKPGWESCVSIVQAKAVRDAEAATAAAEASNPDLKKVRDMAKKLKTEPPVK